MDGDDARRQVGADVHRIRLTFKMRFKHYKFGNLSFSVLIVFDLFMKLSVLIALCDLHTRNDSICSDLPW